MTSNRQSRKVADAFVGHWIESNAAMAIYEVDDDFLVDLFHACNTEQISDFIPDKRGFRIHGHATTVRLEVCYWLVLEAMARRQGLTLPELITVTHDNCLVANRKNLASCLRVVCLKYLEMYSAR